MDCWSVISNLSAIKLGPSAKQSATLQEIPNGRRTGAGATHNYATQWWYPFGIGYSNAGERISFLDEGLKVLRLLWSKPAVLSQLLKHSLVGKPEDIAQKVRKYIDAGIDQFFLAFQDPFDYEAIQLFMNTRKGVT